MASLTRRCMFSRELIGRLCFVPGHIATAGKKTMQREQELPKIPKKPLTPYIQFIMCNRNDIRRNHPGLTNTEVHNRLVDMWQSLTFDEKNLWSLKYEREKADYDVRYKKFVLKLDTVDQTPDRRVKNKSKQKLTPEEEWQAMKERKLLKEKEKNAKKNECDRLGKPKAPGKSFPLYLNSIKDDGLQLKNFLSETSVMWQKLSEEEKEIFRQKARILHIKYQADLLEWETKMCEAGRSDLVRSYQRARLRQRINTKDTND
ncbi:Transcription factor A, mitochondrial [Chionoecetes opilio]|uniref:Transcription factor A, mitochondrial n=1 Tax=Chionoecetes opilio TaxID=41210 RepID=A0A8J4XQA4_CHIOP|nr:Transcription factor A, mitochondrial [Chionoecetes opilio]